MSLVVLRCRVPGPNINPHRAKLWIFPWSGKIFSRPGPGQYLGCLARVWGPVWGPIPCTPQRTGCQGGRLGGLGSRLRGSPCPGPVPGQGAWGQASGSTDVGVSVKIGLRPSPDPTLMSTSSTWMDYFGVILGTSNFMSLFAQLSLSSGCHCD